MNQPIQRRTLLRAAAASAVLGPIGATGVRAQSAWPSRPPLSGWMTTERLLATRRTLTSQDIALRMAPAPQAGHEALPCA